MVAFSGVLAWTAWRMLRQETPRHHGVGGRRCPAWPAGSATVDRQLDWTLPCRAGDGAHRSHIGTLSGLLGVGGGFVIVPALTSHTNPGRRILATSLAVIASWCRSGVSAAALLVDFPGPSRCPFARGCGRIPARPAGWSRHASTAGICRQPRARIPGRFHLVARPRGLGLGPFEPPDICTTPAPGHTL